MRLAKDGIFPITRNGDGQPLPLLPASGLAFPGTIQGEGKLCGIPSLFIRLAGCNLQCCWINGDGQPSPCDTAYAAYRPEATQEMSVGDICRVVRHNTEHLRHIVITGGEPFLQKKELKELCHKLKEIHPYHLTVETNGTLFDKAAARCFDLVSLSPKLSGSHRGSSLPYPGIQPEVIQQFIDCARREGNAFQLKFVCSGERDIREIRALLDLLHHWRNEDVLLMPLGGNAKILQNNKLKTLEYCIRYGWRYCDRLHISLFGDKAGV